MVDLFAATKVGEDIVLLRVKLGRDNQCNVLADCLCREILEFR